MQKILKTNKLKQCKFGEMGRSMRFALLSTYYNPIFDLKINAVITMENCMWLYQFLSLSLKTIYNYKIVDELGY